MGKIVCYSQFVGGATQGSTRVGQGANRVRRKSLLRFLWGGTGEGGPAGLGLATLNNLNGIWGTGAAFSCLKPGPGAIRAGTVACESPINEVVGKWPVHWLVCF